MLNRLTPSRPVIGALAFCGALALSAGCVDNTVSVYIRQVQAPTAAGTTCTYSIDPLGLSISEGTLDVALRNSYTLSPLIANQLLTSGNIDQRRLETATFNVQGFVIELHEGSPDGALIGPAFSIYQNISLPPSLAPMTPGYAVARIQVIPPQVGDALKAAVCRIDNTGVTSDCPVPRVTSVDRRVLVKITAFGESLGQNVIESSPFYFPLTVCCGCLINFPIDSDMPEMMGSGAGPDCNNGMPMMGQSQCALGQDFPVDCRLCAGSNNPLCQPRGFSPTGMNCPR